MHESDNVAIVAAGTTLPGGLVLSKRVPQAHKVALVDIAEGAPVALCNPHRPGAEDHWRRRLGA
jgi:galactarate dehydratase